MAAARNEPRFAISTNAAKSEMFTFPRSALNTDHLIPGNYWDGWRNRYISIVSYGKVQVKNGIYVLV